MYLGAGFTLLNVCIVGSFFVVSPTQILHLGTLLSVYIYGILFWKEKLFFSTPLRLFKVNFVIRIIYNAGILLVI